MSDHYALDINPDDLRSASKSISNLSEHTETKGSAVTRTPGEIGGQWTGNAAVSIKAEMTGLGAQMHSFSAKFTTCKAALDGLADDYDAAKLTLAGLNTKWAQADTDYQSAVKKADDAATTSTTNANKGDPKPPQADLDKIASTSGDAKSAAASARKTTQDGLDVKFEELRTQLRTQTKTAGGKLTDSVPLPVPPEAIGAHQGTGTFPVKLHHGTLAKSLTLAQQFEDQHVQQQLESDGKTAAEELIESRGDISPELAAQLKAQANNPYFAHGFAADLDPTQLNAALATYDDLLANDPDLSADERAQRNDDMIFSIGNLIGTATQGTGDLTLPAEFATTWSKAITDPSMAEDGDSHILPGQSQRLALLMEQGVWGSGFLGTVGTAIYDYERSKGGDPVWSPKAGSMPLVGPDGKSRIDVMASLMKALGNNPEASQTFFATGSTSSIEVDGQDMTVSDRMKYLVQDRTWDSMTDPTNGANLGAALEAATTEFRDQTEQGRTSAELASQMFALIGDKTGEGSDNPGPFNDDGWQMWDGMRASVADVAASYSTDLMRLGRGGPGDDLTAGSVDPEDDLYLENMPYGAALSSGAMQKVIGSLAEDDANIEKILAGLATAGSMRMSNAFQESLHDGGTPPSPVALLRGENIPAIATATNESAATLGWLLNAGYKGRLEDEDLAEKQAEMRGKMFDAFTAVPGIGPAGEWSKFAFDQATSAVSDQLSSSEGTAAGDYGSMSGGEQEKMEQMMLNQMLGAGYFDQLYLDEANGSKDATRFTAPPQGSVTGDPPQFDFDSEEYREWQRRGFPMDGFLNTHVYPSFIQGLHAGLDLPGG